MFGLKGNNFFKTILKMVSQDPLKEIKVVNDQYGSPTWSYRLALQIEKLITTDCQGTWHATAEGYCTWFECACYFLKEMGIPHIVVPCTSQEYPTLATRPKNSILENQRLKKADINMMLNWQNDIASFVSSFRKVLLGKIRKYR